MAKAKYYIYRNLHKDCFSVRYKGKVIDHVKTLVAFGVEFKVNEKTRQRVLQEQKKYVHAFVVCDSYTPTDAPVTLEDKMEVKYNPYHGPHFTANYAIVKGACAVLLTDNKVYAVPSHLEFKGTMEQ